MKGWTTCFVALAMLPAAAAGAQEAGCEPGPGCAVPRPVEEAAAVNRASLEYGITYFGGGSEPEPWHTASAELSRKTRPVTLVARATVAERFGQRGEQFELDAYPRISPRFYGYLNAGWSPSDIFPELRLGAELYANAGGGTELSAGARRLEFAEQSVTILTGSVGRYAGNYYFSARPYVTPREDEGTSYSATLLARRYFSSADSYATLTVGAGTAATESAQEFELDRVSSQRVGVYGKTPVGRRLGVRWSAGYEHEELTRTVDRQRLTGGLGLELRF
ncbi:MAG TPA: YaiO family outer membrane beta-barrel protein [Longimicrobium sp.]|jgi:YaiO family outer membrane protein